MLEVLDDAVHTRAAPGIAAWSALLGLTTRGTVIARTLRTELSALPIPNTDAGREAANYLYDFAHLAGERMAAELRRVRKLSKNITLLQSIRSLQRVETALATAFGNMLGAKDTAIAQYIPELREPFEKADSCKELDTLASRLRG